MFFRLVLLSFLQPLSFPVHFSLIISGTCALVCVISKVGDKRRQDLEGALRRDCWTGMK